MSTKSKATKNVIEIEGKEVQRIFYKGVPVITLGMMDDLHGREEGTAKRNFRANKDKLIIGEDYYEAPYVDWEKILVGRNPSHQDSNEGTLTSKKHGGHRGDMIFSTLTGYLMLVKSFTDDLAWEIQRKLVNNYFKPAATLISSPGKSNNELLAEMKESMKILKMENEINSLAKKLANEVFEAGVSIEDYESVPHIKLAVETSMENDPRYKQMMLFE